ncbi:MAG TPA: helix-turn-helix transcriptional regulator [Solirubrobacterales bacterium]|jgi:DNA-binding PadR family transcriptional regulator|nr:helix-turn-helix transcriptional regulator [Solirubrobacterales bacterium]
MSSEHRLSPTSYIVLALIGGAGEATPYDLKQAVAMTLGNFWSVPHAQIYAEPERLAEGDYLSERREDGGRRRRYYKLTEKGEKALGDWLAEPTGEMAELRDPGMLKLFFGGNPERLASAQLATHRQRLTELETLAEQMEGQPQVPRGYLLTVRAGLGHEREWIRFWSLIEQGEEP